MQQSHFPFKTLLTGFALGILVSTIVFVILDADESAEPLSMEAFLNSGEPISSPLPSVSPSAEQAGGLASVESMISGLEMRLASDDQDMSGWLLLAKSYHFLRRWNEAETAFKKAVALGYQDAWRPIRTIDSANEAVFDTRATAVSGETISLSLSIDPELSKDLPKDTPVFVFARNTEPGPPLAAIRYTLEDLPLTTRLDDSHAMIPGNGISTAEKLVIGVRLSVSGSALGESEDIETLSQPLSSPFDQVVNLTLREPAE